jgi:hypothetical protein
MMPVLIFSAVVIAALSWADFGDAPLPVKVFRLYNLTGALVCGLFGAAWYETRHLRQRIEALEKALAAKENIATEVGPRSG